MYLSWRLCTLHLHACQVRVAVGDSGLRCFSRVTYFERRLTPLWVDLSRGKVFAGTCHCSGHWFPAPFHRLGVRVVTYVTPERRSRSISTRMDDLYYALGFAPAPRFLQIQILCTPYKINSLRGPPPPPHTPLRVWMHMQKKRSHHGRTLKIL